MTTYRHHRVDKAAVIGGGVVGLATAYHLSKAGIEVVVIERDRAGSGASRGNAGEVCPTFSVPLAAPGVVKASLRGLNRRDSALYIRPQLNLGLAQFLLGFARSTRPRVYQAGVQALATLARDAVGDFHAMVNDGVRFEINDRPFLYVYDSREAAEANLAVMRQTPDLDIELPERASDGDELQELEPALSETTCGFALPGQIAIDPSAFVDALADKLRTMGVEIREGARVTAVEETPRGVSISSTAQTFVADAAVITSGVWTAELARSLGSRLPIFPGKGYSFSVQVSPAPTHLIALETAHVGLTPLGELTRVAGTMELDSNPDRFDRRRIDAIIHSARPFLDGVDWKSRSAEWVGPRPMTPNGLPYIGAVGGSDRILVAAGHNMLGVTLAPGTGRAVAGLLAAGDPGLDLAPFAPVKQRRNTAF